MTNQVPLDEVLPPFSPFSRSLDIHEILHAVVTNVPQITLRLRNYDKFRVKCGKLDDFQWKAIFRMT